MKKLPQKNFKKRFTKYISLVIMIVSSTEDFLILKGREDLSK